MIYARELPCEILASLSDLPAAHGAEAGAAPVTLDLDAYAVLDAAGALRIYTARSMGELAGYATWIVSPTNLHHKGLRYAAMDAIYVVPAKRGLTGPNLLRYSERALRGEGVKEIVLNVPLANDWTPLAERMGYERAEVQMRKHIG